MNGGELNFVALGIETANSSPRSVCEIGLVRFESGTETESWSRTIRPRSDSSLRPINFETHGISQEKILAAPYLDEVWGELCEFIGTDPIVAHGTTQDPSKVFQSAQITMNDDWSFPSSEYFCSLVLSRNSSLFSTKSFALRSLSELLQIDPPHVTRNGLVVHSALTDARACGLVISEILERENQQSLKKASESFGVSVGRIQSREITQIAVCKSMDWSPKKMNLQDFKEIKRALHDSGVFFDKHPLSGRAIALTLSLESLSEKEFAVICAILDAELKSGVSSKLDYLVEEFDPTGKYEHGKTGKSKKARELISSGKATISLLVETAFLDLVGEEVIEAAKTYAKNGERESRPVKQTTEKARDYNSRKRKEAEIAYKAFIRKPLWDEAAVAPGSTVGFTQLELETEAKMKSACRSEGIQVTKSFSKKLDLLVIDDRSYRRSAKLRDSFQKGINVCLLSHFLEENPRIAMKAKVRRGFNLRKLFPSN